MADSNRDTSDYVRSAYRRQGAGRSEHGRSKGRGKVWSIIIVILLIVVLAGGAAWMYLNRGGKGLEMASTETESEALIPQDAEPVPAETGSLPSASAGTEEALAPPPSAEEEIAAATPPEGASQEDEFASILQELGIDDTGQPSEAANNAGQPGRTEGGRAAGTAAEPSADVASEEETPSWDQAEEEITQDLAASKEQARMMAQEAGKDVTDQLNKTAGAISSEGQAIKDGFESLEIDEAPHEMEESFAAVHPPESTTATPAPTIEGIAPQTPGIVIVQPGDSLSIIAQRIYGDPNKWPLIYEANQDLLESPDRLLVGMELSIPSRGN